MNEYSIATARWIADRHRLGPIIYVEVDHASAAATTVDEHGASLNKIVGHGAVEDESSAAIQLICDWVCRGRSEVDIALIVGGSLGPSFAARIGAATGYARMLIPDCAGRMAGMGAHLSPAPIQAEMVVPPVALDSEVLREWATRAMEALSEKLARSGYDFDDVICETLACIGWAGDSRFLWATVDPSTRADGLIQELSTSSMRPATSETNVELRSVRAVARVDTRHWDLPMEHETIATRRADEKEIRRLQVEGPIIERSDLAMGSVIPGPVTIRAADHFTVVPRGWTATSCRAGGIQLEYNGPLDASQP